MAINTAMDIRLITSNVAEAKDMDAISKNRHAIRATVKKKRQPMQDSVQRSIWPM